MIAAALVLATAASAAAQETYLLVVAGVEGDAEHGAQFHKWATAMIDAAKTKGGIPDANITYLGDKVERDPKTIKGRSTKEGVTKALTDLAERSRPNDEVFIVLFGHGSFDGKVAAFNLPGPDLTLPEYAQLLSRYMHVRFVNAMLVSPDSTPSDALFERTDSYYVYLKPWDADDCTILAEVKFDGVPPLWIPMPPH